MHTAEYPLNMSPRNLGYITGIRARGWWASRIEVEAIGQWIRHNVGVTHWVVVEAVFLHRSCHVGRPWDIRFHGTTQLCGTNPCTRGAIPGLSDLLVDDTLGPISELSH
jgi:hypothetical protein